MANSYYHAVSSARKFGGVAEDYLEIHNLMDSTKGCTARPYHRAVLHNSYGPFLMEKIFGITITNSNGKEVPVRLVVEQHIVEDHGFIPSIDDWMKSIKPERWMSLGAQKLSQTLEEDSQ